MPEAQLRDTNNQEVLFPLATVGHKHILMARSIAEGPSFYQYGFLCLKFGQKVANVGYEVMRPALSLIIRERARFYER